MMTMGDWFIAEVLQKDPSMDLGLFPVPGCERGGSGDQPAWGPTFIPKKAKHMAEAKRFLEFLGVEGSSAGDYSTRNKFISICAMLRLRSSRPISRRSLSVISSGRTVMTAASSQSVDPETSGNICRICSRAGSQLMKCGSNGINASSS